MVSRMYAIEGARSCGAMVNAPESILHAALLCEEEAEGRCCDIQESMQAAVVLSDFNE